MEWSKTSGGLTVFLTSLFMAVATYSSAAPTTIDVYSEGFFNPRGLAFAPDGTLYVAEAGPPGEVIIPLPALYGGKGPIGSGGVISRVKAGGGARIPVVTGLPNLGIYSGAEILGPSGLAFIGNDLYVVRAAHMTESPTVARLNADGTLTKIADIGEFNGKNSARADNGDAVPGGNPYDMVALDGDLYVSDGNFNRILRVKLDGRITIHAAFTASPTAVGMAVDTTQAILIGQFGAAPYYPGSSRVDRVTPDGTVTTGHVNGLQNTTDVAVGPDGALYILQFAAHFSAQRLAYVPGGGRVLKVEADGTTRPVVDNLMFPTFMTFGPEGSLYISNYGNQSMKGEGQILRVTLGEGVARAPDLTPPVGSPTLADIEAEEAAREQRTAAVKSEAGEHLVRIVEGPDMQKWGYDPPLLTAAVGDRIRFLNAGRMPHTATAADGSFDTGLIPAGASLVVTLTKPGELSYVCTPHPWMAAKIAISGGAANASATAIPKDPAETASPVAIKRTVLVAIIIGIMAAVLGVAFIIRRRENP